MAAHRDASRSARPVRRTARAALVVLGLVAVAIYVLVTGGFAGGQADGTSAGATAAGVELSIDELFDDVAEHDDGSVTVRASEGQAAALVAAGLARSSAPTLRDVSVDLVSVEDGPPGRMIVTGRLADQPLPVRATVDLEIVDAAVRPTVRDARIGPVGVPSSVLRDLDRQLRELAGAVAAGLAVSELRTTDTSLVLTGSRT